MPKSSWVNQHHVTKFCPDLQVTGEHKNLKEPLTAFLDYLEQMNTLMNEEKERSVVV